MTLIKILEMADGTYDKKTRQPHRNGTTKKAEAPAPAPEPTPEPTPEPPPAPTPEPTPDPPKA